MRDNNLSNNLLSPHFASFAFLRQMLLKLLPRLSFLGLSLPKGSMNCGDSEPAMMHCTKTAQLEAGASGPFTDKQVSNSL
jgi:hypothetical protein